MEDFGRFEGEVITKWLRHSDEGDRNMELMEDFHYIDGEGKRWTARKGEVVNGASIPSVFWTKSLGTPFVGNYRRATVLHDVYCDRRETTSLQVHTMFYNAMRCDGVGKKKATLMFEAVNRFGPQWGSRGDIRLFANTVTQTDMAELEAAVDRALKTVQEDADIIAISREVSRQLGD